MTTRSEQLWCGNVAGTGWQTLYTVPSGRRTIVKSISLQNAAVVQSDTAVAAWADAATYLASVCRLPTHAAGNVTVLELWHVLEAGQLLRAYQTTTSLLYVFVSGAELVA